MLPAMDWAWESCRNLELWAGSGDFLASPQSARYTAAA